jgi:hypothetical protein
MKLLDAFAAFQEARSQFEDALHDEGVSEYESLGYDLYDSSVEFLNCHNAMRLTEDQQRIIINAGFDIAYVKHQNGWETQYYFRERQPVRSWRRKRVDGGWLISHWPDGWRDKKWLETGYMKIVPDPLEPPEAA